MQIENHTFLITGGASGLGKGVATHLSQLGANVVIIDLNEQAGNDTAAELGDNVQFIKANVADADAVQQAIDAACATDKPFGGAINCAGIGSAMKTTSKGVPHDLDIFKRVVEVNLVGTFNVLRLAATALEKNDPNENKERGVLISTASIAAFDGQKGQVAYSASKGGVVGMTLPIARDLARSGIRVVTIAPGLFNTPLLMGLPQEARDALEASIPFPSRLGEPSEYALLVDQIIRNPVLNGEVIRLDGALRMQ